MRSLAFACLALGALAFGATAAEAATIQPPDYGPLANPGLAGAFSDRVIGPRAGTSSRARASSSARARASASGYTATYSSNDGYRVEVQLSSAYPPNDENRAGAQQFVDFLASNIHSFELGRLRIFVGTPSEINSICGGGVACYVDVESRMYVPGESTQGVPVGYPLTHEYGHHIAANRSHYPWPAIDWGAKRWSSYELVCSQIDSGRLYPGAEDGDNYFLNPGEAFADAYAHYRYRSAPWQYASSLRPNSGSYTAIRNDVLNRWRGRKLLKFTGSLSSTRRSRTFAVRLSLDGRMKVQLDGPRTANYELRLRSGRYLIDSTRRAGSRDRMVDDLCRDDPGATTLSVQVARRTGSGAFRLWVSYPG